MRPFSTAIQPNRRESSALRRLLAWVEERDRGRRRRPQPAIGRLDLEGRAGLRQPERDPDVADVPLESGRPDQVGDRADRFAVVARRELPGDLERQRVALELDADELALHAPSPD